jgi:uncharacterized protein (DUF488 family)
MIYTIGHSTRTAEEFINLLRGVNTELLVDVRRFPGSRRYPQFGRDALRASLEAVGIQYLHAPELGGRRKATPDSPNTYFRVESFRAYADYMAEPDFQHALAALIERDASITQTIMCAEAVPWRCHRNLISDALVARGVTVRHIVSAAEPHPHVLNPAARLVDGHLVYSKPSDAQTGLFGRT